MMDISVIIQQNALDTRLVQTAYDAMASMDNAVAQNTKRAYANDWDHFVEWCTARGVPYLPTTNPIVALYIQDMANAGYKVSTIQRRMAAINAKHREAKKPTVSTRHDPLHRVWQGIVRTKGTAPTKKKAALTEDIKAMVDTLDDTKLIGIRDRAMLLVGFAGALRRSEIAALNVEDVEFKPQGLFVTIRRSKTDQTGQGQVIFIAYGTTYETCPVRSLQRWIETSGIKEGPLFRSIDRHGNIKDRIPDNTVARVVKRCAEAAGLEDVEKYGAHSLRAGFATTAGENGVSLDDIMRQTRHKSERVARGYIQKSDISRNNPSAKLGL
jgi:site-specific recombinase XerD